MHLLLNSKFSGHNTFSPRFFWFYKVFAELKNNKKEIFNLEKGAVSKFGVGKNMVQAINYWSEAFNLIEKDKSKKGMYRISEFGNLIYKNDPYLENINTKFLLHIVFSTNSENAMVGWLFNKFNETTFTSDVIVENSIEYWKNKSKSKPETIKRDLLTLLNTYAPRKKHTIFNEDIYSTPFAELNLIKYSNESNKYTKERKHNNKINAEIVVFSLLQYWNLYSKNSKTLSLQKSCFDTGSPGSILLLDQKYFEDISDQIKEKTNNRIELDMTSGSLCWRCKKDSIDKIKEDMLVKCL